MNPSTVPSPQSSDQQTQISLLCPPLLVLRSVESDVLQSDRAMVSPEALHSMKASPGELMLISAGSGAPQATPSKKTSNFAPSSLSVELFDEFPPRVVWQEWDLDQQEAVGVEDYCVVCELWPNKKLQKEEIQISGALSSDLRILSPGFLIYLHPFTQQSAVCERLVLTLMKESPLDGFNFEEDGIGMEVLKRVVLSQLHGRILLVRNLVSVLVLGSTLLFQVTSLNTNGELKRCCKINADSTVLEMVVYEEQEQGEYLSLVRKAAGKEMDGSRKEAAENGAVFAAKQGLAALNQLANLDLYIPEQLSKLLDSLVVLPLNQPEIFNKMGLSPPKGVVLHGPPGSGKTMLACWAAEQSKANFFVINGPSLVSEFYGGTESALQGVFSAARKLPPSVIFIDEMDAILQKRTTSQKTDSSFYRILTSLLTIFDGLESGVVVLAATNQLSSLDSALRRPGRFDREIEISLPSPEIRLLVFQQYLKKIKHGLGEEEVIQIAREAHGFLPADISALCREASMSALRRIIHCKDPTDCSVLLSDFEHARSLIRPSGLRESQVEVPCVHWEDIGGLEEIKQQLKESIEWPLKHKESLDRLGVKSPKGVLLFGPPGCSKTLLAKSIATETGMNFISIKGSELLSSFVGESEKSIAQMFVRARQVAPCIVFLDEVDGLLGHGETSHQRRVLSQVLTEMDGVQERGEIVVIGATNLPQVLDPALLRPGRFDRLILVPPPDLAAREAIFKVQFRCLAVGDEVDVKALADLTDGFTGADIVGVCWEAGMEALEENLDIKEISMRHFKQAINKASPSLNQETSLEIYKLFQRSVS